ncbi:MAG: hypothetical protein JSR76_01745 [Verrucomicrobia bacterium]|nr:hypothetical protein [Verrucomicrobiota bacterium]
MNRYNFLPLLLSSSLLALENSCPERPVKAIVPASTKPTCSLATISIDAAYTLWTAREDGLGISLSQIYLASLPASLTGSVFYPEWRLRSGFKVGLDCTLAYDGWDIALGYTWFWNKHNRLISTTSVISSNFLPFSDTFTTSGSWNNWFNRIDGQLGRSFYVGNYVTLRPFLGLLSAFERQSFTIEYSNLSSFFALTIEEQNRQKWFTIGPYIGAETSFICNHSKEHEFSFFLDGGAALGWGHYRTTNVTTGNETSYISNIHNSYRNIDPMIELAFGIRWQNFWLPCYDSSSFVLQAAFETQTWFGHNQMGIVSTQGTSNNYSMQGLTFKAEVNF